MYRHEHGIFRQPNVQLKSRKIRRNQTLAPSTFRLFNRTQQSLRPSSFRRSNCSQIFQMRRTHFQLSSIKLARKNRIHLQYFPGYNNVSFTVWGPTKFGKIYQISIWTVNPHMCSGSDDQGFSLWPRTGVEPMSINWASIPLGKVTSLSYIDQSNGCQFPPGVLTSERKLSNGHLEK